MDTFGGLLHTHTPQRAVSRAASQLSTGPKSDTWAVGATKEQGERRKGKYQIIRSPAGESCGAAADLQ